MGAKRILLVDDDEDLRGALADQFGLLDEFATDEVASGGAALSAIKQTSFDLILLDVGLPDFDGREVCRLMRKAGVASPIVMLTGADTDADTILGLDAGANDYVTKPFAFSVLLARIRAHLRQHEQSEDAVFQIGPYAFKPASKMMERQGGDRPIRLTEKETAILKYLFRAAGKAVSREELLNQVWGYNAGVTTHTLETHVYRLRQKIEDNPAKAQILQTEPGGYRLNRQR
ncbi:winged helix family two component transcriptional regulator [Rhodothalassium salexigens DSM 2132]|uniref:Winged helix family two component transcriptional regulator n=1 Tax=Rhodothalassium salexigens DSM 2132 TaxID=1188247 RepID=A0A4R2PPM8_RHOSA|nr:response regulator transcription factor [Rhodothalassium salexigens]MBB4211203.1 DNA-binding response OmpR family regulator [Rhodothalassium salexigens DSM 2132]MBK1637543.1 DNA-binding response regulator [Rhodothalassium salexigens DSM 2132]TCP36141.1 winged helix family two component transcriptional regulator [Rhodothalassium salexigens DSM 2132]